MEYSDIDINREGCSMRTVKRILLYLYTGDHPTTPTVLAPKDHNKYFRLDIITEAKLKHRVIA